MWWIIVITANIIGQFLGRYGMISKGYFRPLIEFIGWLILASSFVMAWVFLGFKVFLVMIPTWWVVSFVLEIPIRWTGRKIHHRV